MAQSPADGERAALRGYRWQYDRIAVLVYDALCGSDFVALRLADPGAGRVDDLILRRKGRTDAYQFRSVEFPRPFSFRQLVEGKHVSGESGKSSLIRTLADGWIALRPQWDNISVHFVTNQVSSVRGRISNENPENSSTPGHFSAFLTHVYKPIHNGSLALIHVPPAWSEALTRLRTGSGIPVDEFGEFLQSLYLEFNEPTGLPKPPSRRRSDIIALSDSLYRYVSEAPDVVELDTNGILELMGWQDRTLLRSQHEFPVDLDTYSPLAEAITQLEDSILKHDSGYVAVIGPPGAGKSTLLSQALTGCSDRVVRYFAYVPNTTAARTRLTAQAFLHDIVLMLHKSGLRAFENQIASEEIHELRQHLAEQLDAANREFAGTGRRTILIVDGLDHVDREYSGYDRLLTELPRPEEFPNGVLIVVGSRTLAPLRAQARQQVGERNAVIDLQYHTLSPSSIQEICERVPVTAELAPSVHLRIANLSKGHPLALSYLLNRLRVVDGDARVEVLEQTPEYTGDIAALYREVWDEVEENDGLVEIFAICSRLRIGFTRDFLYGIADKFLAQKFQRKFQYLFREYNREWRFFHDSFRQYVLERTSQDGTGRLDEHADASCHGRIAVFCANSNNRIIASEQLFHRFSAGQSGQVLSLANQEVFRAQYLQLRSPELIREDIGLALRIAADEANVPVMLSLLLALMEVASRDSVLEDVDIPGLLYESGLVDEAIAYCGEASRIPLSQAFDLAARLWETNNPAGRRLFDLIEHRGPHDSSQDRISGQEFDITIAWTRAAVLFRPFPTVIAAIRNLADGPLGMDHRERYEQVELWHCYLRAMKELIESEARKKEKASLVTIEETLAEDGAKLTNDLSKAVATNEEASTRDSKEIAETILDLRILSQAALIELANTAEAVECHLDELLSTIGHELRRPSTILYIAEILVRHRRNHRAREMLDQSPYSKPLTVSDLHTYGGSSEVGLRFQFWRLRYLLATNDFEIPETAPCEVEVLSGVDIGLISSFHSDLEAIDLVVRVDAAIRMLGQLDAAIDTSTEPPSTLIWTELIRLLDMFQQLVGLKSTDIKVLSSEGNELVRLLTTVVRRFGNGFPKKLSDELARRIREQPRLWSCKLRLNLADDLREAGTTAPWYRETIAELEANAVSESLNSRLDVMADLLRRHSRSGEQQKAQRIVTDMVGMAFGIGYRKDYQFDHWVDWLGLALLEPDGSQLVNEAAWLARLLVTLEPMTEGAPRSAAVALPAAVAAVDPLAAVRIFEYFVRHGTVSHLNALSELVIALVQHSKPDGIATVALAADITCELLAAAADCAYPELAASIVEAAERAVGPTQANRLAEAMANRTDRYALKSSRKDWRRALGLVSDSQKPKIREDISSSRSDYDALALSDGRRIARGEVPSELRCAQDIVDLRLLETSDSSFYWEDAVRQFALTRDDIQALLSVFHSGSRKDSSVLVVLAEAAEREGDHDTALHLASVAFESAEGTSWGRFAGFTRLRASAISVRLGDESARVAACQDLAHQAIGTSWLPRLLLSDLQEIVQVIGPNLSACSFWAEIRTYLNGMAETLDLGDDNVLTGHECRWWLQVSTEDQRGVSNESTPAVALAELAVGHLSHPTWLVRDAASTCVIRALIAKNQEVARALGRFAQPDSSDDTLERAGRCLAAASISDGYVIPAEQHLLEHTLENHPSQVLRSLAVHRPPRAFKPLSGLFTLELPSSAFNIAESKPAFLYPFEDQYELLASAIGLNLGSLLAVATRYASGAHSLLPREDEVREALKSSGMRFGFALPKLASSRAAYGRVIADLLDSGRLDEAIAEDLGLLRTADIEFMVRTPSDRPSVIPDPPNAGIDMTFDRWSGEITSRLDEYIAASTGKDRFLIGSKSWLKVLNWSYLEEKIECGTTIGTRGTAKGTLFDRERCMLLRDLAMSTASGRVERGEPLIMENLPPDFYQINEDWLAFRPDIAGTLGWVPDLVRPGCWKTTTGELAVETIWWVDGWLGREGRAHDDTEAIGYAVVLTPLGMRGISAKFGELTRYFILTRFGRGDCAEGEPLTVERSLPLQFPIS